MATTPAQDDGSGPDIEAMRRASASADDRDRLAFDEIAARLEAEMAATPRDERGHMRGVRTALFAAAGALWAALTVLGLAAGWGVVLLVCLAAAVAVETYYNQRHPRSPVRAYSQPSRIRRQK
ncbi:hypothetical protein M1L60_44605 [Actinoplanes sp. TRM 88003]|uniref:DUF3040 domain-containing protein n=1 Tax=Paractinoplanes aksuensis TaxID=2939490 RepID=A0ABT1E3H9_9ACTN|nr:hypothetical protein [Actinoplanes aksuensis]MCO8277679.1 hypothetical protein [Actinoplanes aksuensis]